MSPTSSHPKAQQQQQHCCCSSASSTQTTSSPHYRSTPSHQNTTSSSTSKKQYYLISNLPPLSPGNARYRYISETTTAIDSWQEPFTIEDEDLMFDGKPLNQLYEMNREQEEKEMRSRRSSGESERSVVWKEEMRRGRRRDRK